MRSLGLALVNEDRRFTSWGSMGEVAVGTLIEDVRVGIDPVLRIRLPGRTRRL